MAASSEVFRFVTVRPPQESNRSRSTDDLVDIGRVATPLTDSLRGLRADGTRAAMVRVAAAFTRSADFVDSPRKLDPRLHDLTAAVRRLPERDFWSAVRQAFARIIDGSPSDFVASEIYRTTYQRTSDSIVAAAIDESVSPRVRALLVGWARTLWLIRRLAQQAPLSRPAFMRAPVVLPSGIFPLPVEDADLRSRRKAAADASKAIVEARQKRLAQLTHDLAAHQDAADELIRTFKRTGATAPAPTTRRSGGRSARSVSGFLLSDTAAANLSPPTRQVLQKMGIASKDVDVTKSVTLLEEQSAALARELYAGGAATGTMVRVGGRIVPQGAFVGGLGGVPGGIASEDDLRLPGPCPPVPATDAPDDGVTVPSGHGEARILGMGALMVLEQELLRYQLGEIAHIENVLKSEKRSRTFKTTDTTERIQTTETETVESKEQDLSSAERFELQTESQTIIAETTSKDAGVTVHASYGPSVDATATVNVATTSSTEQSTAAATNYSREVTTRAVERVQARTLTRRTVRTVNVIEETNEHSFENTSGPDIVGVYRFVDKIYRAQVVNYGTRLMLEFIVPEPAAFLRHALTHKPLDTVGLTEPEPPGYCQANGTTFVPLQASDITPEHYLYWTSKYGAQDVSPPPPKLAIASAAKKALEKLDTVQSDGERKIASDTIDVPVPDGYLCQSAFVNIYGETQLGTHKIVFQLQDQQGEYIEPVDDGHLFSLHLQPTPTLIVTVNAIGFHNYEVLITVFCVLSQEKYEQWQLKTFASIMNAYHDLKSVFDQAMREARLQAVDGTIGGTNPANNRITEQTELKKGCISLLTGQRFELFDAVNRNVAPFGYPEIDFAEARAEGAYIQMFEQSFEWNNIVYLFYPYFWARKDDWIGLAQLTDVDPLFAQFLRAGAARVQVPVRVGFEDLVLSYLSTGALWTGEGAIINGEDGEPDPLHLSVIDELKSLTGNNNVEGAGTLSVTKNSATVAGSETAFTSDDEQKRIVIAGVTYVIKTVDVETQTITLRTPYAGDTDEGVGYAIGGKLVGQPWEVKLPTDLVKLDNTLAFS